MDDTTYPHNIFQLLQMQKPKTNPDQSSFKNLIYLNKLYLAKVPFVIHIY